MVNTYRYQIYGSCINIYADEVHIWPYQSSPWLILDMLWISRSFTVRDPIDEVYGQIHGNSRNFTQVLFGWKWYCRTFHATNCHEFHDSMGFQGVMNFMLTNPNREIHDVWGSQFQLI